MTHEHQSCNITKGSMSCWTNKTTFVQISLVCYVCIMKFERMALLFRVYLTFKLLKYSKVHISALLLTINLIFGELKNILNLLGKMVRRNSFLTLAEELVKSQQRHNTGVNQVTPSVLSSTHRIQYHGCQY